MDFVAGFLSEVYGAAVLPAVVAIVWYIAYKYGWKSQRIIAIIFWAAFLWFIVIAVLTYSPL